MSPSPAASAPAPADLSVRMTRWLVATAILLFLALGIPQLSRPFQGDEVEFVRLGVALFEHGNHQVDRGFIDDVVETGQFQLWSFHPPLYMWALGAACKVFGVHEATVRGFGLACGVASLLLVFAITRRVAGPPLPRNLIAALATALCAVNPFFLQGCLLVDIDGTVYTTLFLLLVYLALRLDTAGERTRLPVLAAVFAATLTAKMTTVLVFPVVLCGYHVLRRDWRRAAGDALVIGAGGTALFLVAFWAYCSAVGLNFAGTFTHTSRSGGGFASVGLLLRLFAFILPLPLLWNLFVPRDEKPVIPRVFVLALVALGLGLLYAVHLLRPGLGFGFHWSNDLTSYFLITVPFLTPALLVLLYGALATRTGRWIRGRFEPVDLPLALAVAVLVAYIGVMTRGAVFSLYQTPVVPLLAVAVAHALGAAGLLRPEARHAARAFGAVVAIGLAYGVLVLGDAYFLVKYRLFDVQSRDVFGAIVRGWAELHASDPVARRDVGQYFGYQPAGLAAIWYALALLPLLLVCTVGRRWLAPAASLGAMTLGLGLALCGCQAAASYSTGLVYGKELTDTREMAAFINANIRIEGPYLAPRGLAFYIHQPGFIDHTRYGGGYRHTTRPTINASGELVLNVADPADALPRGPIHFAVGDYPLLDQSPGYRVVKQIGQLKLYVYEGAAGAHGQAAP